MGSESSPEVTSTHPRHNHSGSTFEELEVVRNADYLVAHISRRTRSNQITFAISKEFERDGETQRTQFIPLELKDSFMAIVKTTIEKCEEYQKQYPPLPPHERRQKGGRR